MRCEFHPEALAEYREAANWYENREPGVGLKFVAEVEDAIGRIEDGPERWRIIGGGYNWFWSLTPAGEALMFELRTIKASALVTKQL